MKPIALGLLLFLLGNLSALSLVTYWPLVQNRLVPKPSPKVKIDYLGLQRQVLPESGFSLPVAFEDLGPKLLAVGAIDLTKFERNFQREGGLTPEQKEILTQTTNRRISINRKNAAFLLDFFWALGLSNKNPILDQGPMVQDRSRLGNFASTAGWTLGRLKPLALYSAYTLINLTPEQQQLVAEIVNNVYRPCCGNATIFPDCNHGMAALGLTEYLVAKGLSRGEVYLALLHFNSFWFPQNYLDLAAFFQLNRVGWSSLSPQLILSRNYSSIQGYARIKQDLDLKSGVPASTSGPGRGCGT